ncbi:MAG TPA: hypothetical protein VH877_09750 [Polyangia bacterium]|jgi:hypothetical protein|nr:hypothetical protein [Polyangia bacterium]
MMRNTLNSIFGAIAISAMSLAAGCGAPEAENSGTAGTGLGLQHSTAVERGGERAAQVTGNLTYYGGPVIQNVKVVTIYWNSSVNYRTATPSIDNFYSAVTNSTYMDWLCEYNTTTPAQSIGRGSLAASFTDSQTSTAVTDAQIQQRITALINAGSVPLPDANTYYAVHFPPGVSITASDGSKSCVQFCAYHGTYARNTGGSGTYIYYGVLPDLGGACAGGCGGSTQYNNTTSVASHELIEAITDAAVGVATTYGPPLAWYDQTNGEIGDICNASQGSVVGADGRTYTVQREWSNKQGACVVSGAACSGGGGGGGNSTILNPGFESGAVSWTQSSGVISNSATNAHSGSYVAWLNGYGSAHTDTLYQDVALSSTATNLCFWLRITTAETTTTTAYDTLTAQLRNTSNGVLTTLGTYSNLNKGAYAQRCFNVSAYRNQTVRVYFTGTEDSSLQTSFFLDDFTLQ